MNSSSFRTELKFEVSVGIDADGTEYRLNTDNPDRQFGNERNITEGNLLNVDVYIIELVLRALELVVGAIRVGCQKLRFEIEKKKKTHDLEFIFGFCEGIVTLNVVDMGRASSPVRSCTLSFLFILSS